MANGRAWECPTCGTTVLAEYFKAVPMECTACGYHGKFTAVSFGDDAMQEHLDHVLYLKAMEHAQPTWWCETCDEVPAIAEYRQCRSCYYDNYMRMPPNVERCEKLDVRKAHLKVIEEHRKKYGW